MSESSRNLYIVAVLGMACLLQSAADECPYNTTLCTCIFDFMDMECTGLQELPMLKVGPTWPQYMGLTLANGNITFIGNDSLPPDLYEFAISGHPLANLSDNAFDNSATTLTDLDITAGKFTELPGALLSITMLVDLHIADTHIEHWDEVILQHLAGNLRELQFNNVGLLSWPSWISKFHLLQTLDLSGNLLKSTPDDAFSSFKDSLTALDLGNTGLTHVPKALSVLTSLTSLNLSGNNFVDQHEFEQLAYFPIGASLSALYLLSVGFTRIPNFSNMTSLTEIHLDNNNISDYTADSFPRSVLELSLTRNRLSTLPTAVSNIPRLSSLDMSRNQISEIPTGSLPTTLQKLDLSYNKFFTITNTTFSNLTSLTTLSLNNNPISTISLCAFADLQSLGALYLDNTNLTEFPLALTKLSHYRLFVDLTNISSLTCPCPIFTQLITWYSTQGGIQLLGNCKYGQPIAEYFYNNYKLLTSPATTTSSHGSDLKCRHPCGYSSLVLLLLSCAIVMG